MAARSRILSALGRWKLAFIAGGLIELSAEFAGAVLLSLSALYWLGRFELSVIRPAAAFFSAAALVWLAASRLGKIFSGLGDGDVIALACGKETRQALFLVPAAEISRRGIAGNVSARFADEHLRLSAELVKTVPAPFFFRLPRRILFSGAVFAALSLAFAVRSPGGAMIFFSPFSAPLLEPYFEIFPGNARIASGARAAISGRWLAKNYGTPGLLVKPEGGNWLRRNWPPKNGGFELAVDPLVETVYYKAVFNGMETRAYALRPRRPPEFLSEKIEITPPAYIGLKPFPVNTSPEIEAPAGSLVKISGFPSEKISKAEVEWTPDGGNARLIPLKKDFSGRLSGVFLADAGGNCRVFLVSSDGWTDSAPPTRRVAAVPDFPPQAELLSPYSEAEVDSRETVRLSASVRDDYGLDSVELVSDGAARTLERFPAPGPKLKTASASVDFAGIPDGNSVRVYFRALDRNSGAGVSESVLFHVKDFSKSHAAALEKIERARLRALSLAENHRSAAELFSGSVPASGFSQSEIESGWDEFGRELSSAGEAAGQDGYMSPAVYEALSAASAREAWLKPLARKANSAGAHNTLASELENIAELLSLARGNQTLADFKAGISRLESLAQNVSSGLENPAWDELLKTAREIEAELSALSKIIAALSSEEGTFFPPVDSAYNLSAQLSAALSEKNYDKARSLLKELSEALAALRSAFEGELLSRWQSAGMASPAKFEKLSARWAELAGSQSEAVSSTREISDSRAARKIPEQKKLLAQAEKTAGELLGGIPQARVFLEDLRKRDFKSLSESRRVLSAELKTSSAAAENAEKVFLLIDEAQNPPLEFSAGEAEALRSGARNQAAVRKKAAALSEDISALSKNLLVSPEAGERLRSAMAEMEKAEPLLSALEAVPALSAQEEALKYLEDGKENLASARSAAGRINEGSVIPSRSSGKTDTSYVKLPSERDYLPPADIRAKLIESSGEKVPAPAGGIIKEYLHRLAQ